MLSGLNIQSFFKSGFDILTRGALPTIPDQAKKVYEFVKNNQSTLLKFVVAGGICLGLNYLSKIAPHFYGSANEMNLFKACGKSCFFEDKNSTKPLVLWLNSINDHNGAYSLFNKYEIDRFTKINEQVDLVFGEIPFASAICYHLSKLSRKVDSLIIGAHGNPEAIELFVSNPDTGEHFIKVIWNMF